MHSTIHGIPTIMNTLASLVDMDYRLYGRNKIAGALQISRPMIRKPNIAAKMKSNGQGIKFI